MQGSTCWVLPIVLHHDSFSILCLWASRLMIAFSLQFQSPNVIDDIHRPRRHMPIIWLPLFLNLNRKCLMSYSCTPSLLRKSNPAVIRDLFPRGRRRAYPRLLSRAVIRSYQGSYRRAPFRSPERPLWFTGPCWGHVHFKLSHPLM
jgi:hypothetical protein